MRVVSVLFARLRHRFARRREIIPREAQDKSASLASSRGDVGVEGERQLNIGKVSRDETRDEFPARAFSASLS